MLWQSEGETNLVLVFQRNSGIQEIDRHEIVQVIVIYEVKADIHHGSIDRIVSWNVIVQGRFEYGETGITATIEIFLFRVEKPVAQDQPGSVEVKGNKALDASPQNARVGIVD